MHVQRACVSMQSPRRLRHQYQKCRRAHFQMPNTRVTLRGSHESHPDDRDTGPHHAHVACFCYDPRRPPDNIVALVTLSRHSPPPPPRYTLYRTGAPR